MDKSKEDLAYAGRVRADFALRVARGSVSKAADIIRGQIKKYHDDCAAGLIDAEECKELSAIGEAGLLALADSAQRRGEEFDV